MVTYSRRRWCGWTTELGQQSREIAAREGPAEGLRGGDVVVLELQESLTDGVARPKSVRREDLALDHGEIDFDLIEPAGVDGGMDEHELRPPGLQPCDSALPAMQGGVPRSRRRGGPSDTVPVS